tara:strand:+ start:510 stop:779 length:270 start_codon:yes stop_codon:yes gene_type:complete
MKNYFIIFFILILIVFTSLTKSSTRELEAQIYLLEEDIKKLSDKKDLILLENNFLSSPERLFDLKKILFEENLIPLKIKKFIILQNDGK